jgi:pimeloyl-ACP methyl ester carboxylesterase
VRERAGDAGLLLDHIRSKATDPDIVQIRAHLAPNVAGIMGYSFGGSIAAEAKVLDDRFTAALNLDGWHFGASVNGVPWPYLLVLSQEATDFYTSAKNRPQPPAGHDAKLTLRDFEVTIPSLRQRGAYLLSVTGANHYNFADGAFSGSLFRDGQGLGTLNKYRAYEIIAEISVAYFDAHLRRDASIATDRFQRHYPETTLLMWRPTLQLQR